MPFLDQRRRRRGDDAAARAQECRPVRGDAARTRSIRSWRGCPPPTATISPAPPSLRHRLERMVDPGRGRSGFGSAATRSAAASGRWPTSMAGCSAPDYLGRVDRPRLSGDAPLLPDRADPRQRPAAPDRQPRISRAAARGEAQPIALSVLYGRGGARRERWEVRVCTPDTARPSPPKPSAWAPPLP